MRFCSVLVMVFVSVQVFGGESKEFLWAFDSSGEKLQKIFLIPDTEENNVLANQLRLALDSKMVKRFSQDYVYCLNNMRFHVFKVGEGGLMLVSSTTESGYMLSLSKKIVKIIGDSELKTLTDKKRKKIKDLMEREKIEWQRIRRIGADLEEVKAIMRGETQGNLEDLLKKPEPLKPLDSSFRFYMRQQRREPCCCNIS